MIFNLPSKIADNYPDVLAVGGHLDPETLYEAYTKGLFPWPVSKNDPIPWFCPNPRGVIEVQNFKVPKSFQKFLKKTSYTYKFNEDFNKIINTCASIKREGQDSTWIIEGIIKGYTHLYEKGYAFSVAVYDGNELIGGLYGVNIGEIIAGESMFHHKTNASKFALYNLLLYLQQKGIKYFDTQMVTPVVELFGGKYIERKEFLKNLESLNLKRSIF